MWLTNWIKKRFASGIAQAMKETYLIDMATRPIRSEREVFESVLQSRPGRIAESLARYVKREKRGLTFFDLTFLLVTEEWKEANPSYDSDFETIRIFNKAIMSTLGELGDKKAEPLADTT